LLTSPGALARVPLFLLAFLVVRGIPAVLYAPAVGRRQAVAAGLLQATTLPFVVTATAIGVSLGLMTPVTAAALVAAGLVSVVAFPLVALALLRGEAGAEAYDGGSGREARKAATRRALTSAGGGSVASPADRATNVVVARSWSR
jgi:Kef-type K+ transport system membrane component KefB